MLQVILITLIDVVFSQCIGGSIDDSCSFCQYDQYSPNQLSDNTVRPHIDECQANQLNLQTLFQDVVYIGAEPCGNRDCSGTQIDPYDNLISAFYSESQKAAGYLNAQITFILLAGNHFILKDDITTHQTQFFRRRTWSITIKSIKSKQLAYIYLKTDQIHIFVGYQLIIQDVVFNGIDISLVFEEDQKKSIQCQENILQLCNIESLPFYANRQQNEFYGLINLEYLFDMDDQNKDLQSFMQTNNLYKSVPPKVYLSLINVQFIKLNTGLIINSQIMQGFKGIIIDLFGFSQVTMSDIFIEDSFFPEGFLQTKFKDNFYNDDQNYLNSLGNNELKGQITINNFQLSKYNSQKIGTLYGEIQDISLDKYFNEIINLRKRKVVINNLEIKDSSVVLLQEGRQVYGGNQLFLKIFDTSEVEINNLKAINLLNIQLFWNEGTQVIKNGDVKNVEIQFEKNNRVFDSEYYLIYNGFSKQLTIENIKFDNVDKILKIDFQTATFYGCSIRNIMIKEYSQLFYIVSQTDNHIIELDSCNFYNLQGSENDISLTTIFYNKDFHNKFAIKNSQLSNLKNIILIKNNLAPYSFDFLSSTLRDVENFAISIINRYKRVQIHNSEFINIKSDEFFLLSRGQEGTTPYFYFYNNTVSNFQGKGFMNYYTARGFLYFENTTFENFDVEKEFFTMCCFNNLEFYSVKFQNIKFQNLLLQQGGYTFVNQIEFENISENENILLDGSTNVLFTIIKMKILMNQKNRLLQGNNLNGIKFINCIIEGYKLSNIIEINTFNNLEIDNTTIQEKSSENQITSGYFINLFSAFNIYIRNSVFTNIRQSLFISENQRRIEIHNSSFTKIQCNFEQSCIYTQNQLNYIHITNCNFNNIQAINFMKFDFSIEVVLLENYLQDITFDESLFTSFQTNSLIKRNRIIDCIQTKSVEIIAIQIMDSQNLILHDNSIIQTTLNENIINLKTQLINIVDVKNLTFVNITTHYFSILHFSEFSQMEISQLTFKNCISSKSIFKIEISLKQLTIILNNIMCINTNGVESSCLHLLTESIFNINNLTVDSNKQGNNVVIFAQNEAVIRFNQVSIFNSKTINLLELQKIRLFIHNFKISNIQCQSIIHSEESQIYLSQNHFQIIQGSFIFDLLNSQLNIQNLNAFNDQNNQIQFMNSQFSNIVLSELFLYNLADQIFTFQDSILSIKKSYFQSEQAITFFELIQTSLEIQDSKFILQDNQKFISLIDYQVNEQYFILANSQIYGGQQQNTIAQIKQITITNSEIQNSILLIQNFLNLQIIQSIFSEINYSCLDISTAYKANILIDRSLFQNCISTENGGGLLIQGKVQGLITNSQFQNNEAVNGGGIYYDSNYEMKIQDSRFSNNKAKLYGGGAVAVSSPLKFVQTSFEANLAISQQKNGTFGTTYRIYNADYEILKQLNLQDRIEYIQKQNVLETIEFASGQDKYLIIGIIDTDGKIVVSDESTRGEFVTLPDDDKDKALLRGAQSISENGIMVFKITIIKKPGDNFFLNLVLDFQDYDLTTFQVRFLSRKCIKGEIYKEDETCVLCVDDTYSLPDPHNPLFKTQACQYCMENGFCISEAIYPGSGYWISDPDSVLLLQCKQEQYCLGKKSLFENRKKSTNKYEVQIYKQQTVEMYDKQCLDGHGAVMCQECLPGYFKFTSTSQCIPCQGNKAVTFLIIILIFVGLMYYSIFQSQNYMLMSQEGKDFAILLKIFFNYIQTLSLLGSVALDWSPNISAFFDFSQDFFGTQFNMVSLQCLSFEYFQDVEKQFYMNLVLQMFIPFVVYVLNTIYFLITIYVGLKSIQKKNALKQSSSITSKTQASTNQNELKQISLYVIILNGVVCLHLFYPLLTQTPTQLFYCMKTSEDYFGNTKSFLSKNLFVQCWTTRFNYWFYSFGITLSVIFGLGIPLLLGSYMYLYKADLKEMDSNLNSTFLHKSSTLKHQTTTTSKVTKNIGEMAIFGLKKESQKNFDQKGIIAQSPKFNEVVSIKPAENNNTKKQSQFQKKYSLKALKGKLFLLSQMNKQSTTKALKKSLKQKKLKGSEVFHFLVDPYKSRIFYWEIVINIILLRKFLLIVVGLLTGLSNADDQNKNVKYLLLNIYLIFFYKLNLRFNPYFSPLFNQMENYSFLVIILTCLAGIITSAIPSIGAQVISDIIFFTTNFGFILFTAFASIALKYASEQTSSFKIISILSKLHKRRKHNAFQVSQSQSRLFQDNEQSEYTRKGNK